MSFVIGDADLARRMLREAANSPVAPRVMQILAYSVLSLCEAEQGKAALSRTYAQQAMAIVTDHTMQAMPNVLHAYIAYGSALAADARLVEAMDILQAGLRTRRQTQGLSPWPLIHHLIAMADLAYRLGDPDHGEELLTELDTLIPWTDDTMALTHARIALARRKNRHDHSRPADVNGRNRSADAPALSEPLTAREHQILHRLRGTQTLHQIAADLHISHNTVKTITLSVFRKLGAHSRAEAVTIATRAEATQPTPHAVRRQRANRPSSH